MKHIGLYITLLSAGLALTGCDFFCKDYTADWGTPIVDDNTVINNLIANMVYVEGGTFTMGATSEQGSDAYSDESPTHSVTLSSFSIGKYEVTQAEWKAVMGSNPSFFTGSDDLPVEQVCWYDCKTFITKLNALTGKNFRLPTEAEWEYAARGGNKSKGYKYAGSNNIDDVAWYTSNSEGKTHAVGTKQPNELGLYDMSGNVYEWCSDWWGDYSSSSQTNPTGASSGDCRVNRGGSWQEDAEYCRVSFRYYDDLDERNEALGLRLVLEVESDKSTEEDATEEDATKIIDNLVNNMVYVAGGTFTMGATSEQGSDVYSNESPTHSVTLSNFSIGKYEVTQAEWQAVMGSNPSNFTGDNLPVECVSCNDCQTFITKLNTLTGKNFRLPTEAEWEYAARGGSKSQGYKYAGSDNIDDVAWYTSNSGSTTHAVGTKQPNELGLYDMSGNVLEWCSDWYGSYSSSSQTNPTGASSGSDRVSRGGSWCNFAGLCRVSDRNCRTPDNWNYDLGLRLVLDVESDKSTEEDATEEDATKVILDNLVNNMVYVAGGTFTMGGTSEQGSDVYSNESPTHSVTLSNFSIGKYEVTQAEWQAVMGSNPSNFTGDNLPVECVSCNDCQTFITKLNTLTGKNFRLPTEAEWEYAARGGSKSQGYKYAGSDNIDDVAWYTSNSGSTTHAVGTKQPNELGLYDMSGNVWEWCSDWYGSYSSSSQTNPTGASSGSYRVYRGGSWSNSAGYCRVSDRSYDTPGFRFSLLGLRLALPVQP